MVKGSFDLDGETLPGAPESEPRVGELKRSQGDIAGIIGRQGVDLAQERIIANDECINVEFAAKQLFVAVVAADTVTVLRDSFA